MIKPGPPATLHSSAPMRLVVPVDCAMAGRARTKARPQAAQRKDEKGMKHSIVEVNIPQQQASQCVPL
jgi:hypothetical protein